VAAETTDDRGANVKGATLPRRTLIPALLVAVGCILTAIATLPGRFLRRCVSVVPTTDGTQLRNADIESLRLTLIGAAAALFVGVSVAILLG
jgi:hypothetical protein